MKLRYRYVSYGAGQNAIDQMQQLHGLMHQLMARTASSRTGAWQPPTDVYETTESVVVQVELAGVREEDIDVTLFSDHLAIAGTRRNKATSSAAYLLAGILYGDFQLAVPMVASVNRDAVEATYQDGLLTIKLPKAVERIEAISVQTSALTPPPQEVVEAGAAQTIPTGAESAPYE